MKVLFWVERTWPEIGGIETFTRQLVPAMHLRGHEIVIISSSFAETSVEKDPELGFTIWRFPFSAAFKKRDLRQIKTISDQVINLIRTFQPDLIHLNTYLTSSFYFLRIPGSIRPPTLLTLHSHVKESEIANAMQTQILHNVDYIVGVSKTTLESYIQVYPELTSRAYVIYNSVNFPISKPTALPFERPVILGLGRLSFEKGFDVALKAFALVHKTHPDPQLKIGGDGDERSALADQARKLGIAESVHFIGFVHHDKVPELMNQSTIVIVPSRFEPFGLTALEAAFMARPVIASRVGGLPEVVVHQKTGLLVKATNHRNLAESIITLIENPEITVSYGNAAQERAKNEFSMSQFVDNYERVYRKVAGK